MDIVAEVLNSTNLVGFPYTWSTRNSHDEYSVQFGDLWALAGRAGRIAGGDNRPLPIHERSWQERIVSLYSKPWSNLPVRRPPVLDTVSVPILTASIRGSQLPVVVVFYYTTTDFEKTYFPQLAQLAQDEEGKIQFFVVSLDEPKDQHWVYWLFERHQTLFDALLLHPWSAEEFAAAQITLGVSPRVAQRCTCPRAILFDGTHALRLLDDQLTDVRPIRTAIQQMR
jgi:Tat protein secretion system quality control protein TatD with DNase activity